MPALKATPEQLVAGVKLDEGKPRFDLIPPSSMTALAAVFGRGAQKYESRNWEKGLAYGRIYAAMQRHLHAFWAGEEHDPETGLPHLAQAMFGCAVLLEYRRTGVGSDDRSTLVESAPSVPPSPTVLGAVKRR